MKYVHHDNSKVLGFFDPEIHDYIPEPNFAISDEVWQAYLSDQASYSVIDGQLAYTPVVIPDPTPAEIMASKMTALDAEYAPQRKDLWDYLGLAVNYWQDTEAAASIRSELTALEDEYNAKVQVIVDGYNASVGGN
jgi:hypothetical protein